MSLVVWSALIPVLPFMLASLLIDGPQTMLASLQHIDLLTILSLLYLAFIATIVGYGIWGSLLGRYETWRVAPLSLLVPWSVPVAVILSLPVAGIGAYLEPADRLQPARRQLPGCDGGPQGRRHPRPCRGYRHRPAGHLQPVPLFQ